MSQVTHPYTSSDYQVASIDSWLQLYYEDLPKYSTDPPATSTQLAAAFDRWHARTDQQFEQLSQGVRMVTFHALLDDDTMLQQWYSTSDGRAALITLCDGVPHFMVAHRPTALPLILDMQRLVVQLVSSGELQQYSRAWQTELLMPCMHSERIDMQQLGIAEYTRLQAEPWLTITRDHLAVLQRFGRFPYLHDSDMTAEEQQWMQSDDIPLYIKVGGHVTSTYHLQVNQDIRSSK